MLFKKTKSRLEKKKQIGGKVKEEAKRGGDLIGHYNSEE